jgi:hypothetical protein
MGKREKLIILLAHIEPLIYKTLEISKTKNMKLKPVVKKVSVEDNGSMSAESLGKIYVLAVMCIIYTNTDAYTNEIDKRIPFTVKHNLPGSQKSADCPYQA